MRVTTLTAGAGSSPQAVAAKRAADAAFALARLRQRRSDLGFRLAAGGFGYAAIVVLASAVMFVGDVLGTFGRWWLGGLSSAGVVVGLAGLCIMLSAKTIRTVH